MDLKLRRNLPLLLLFVAVVVFLVLGLGDQPIIAYTFEKDGGQNDGTAFTESEQMDDLQSSPESLNAGIAIPEADTAGVLQSEPDSGLYDDPAQDPEISVDPEGINGSNTQQNEE